MPAAQVPLAESPQAEAQAERRRTVDRPRRVVRLIARLNIGGPAIHTILLSERLREPDYTSLLVTGQPDAVEGDLGPLALSKGLRVITVPTLRRRLSLWHDLHAWWRLFTIIRREQPDIVHTHTAKAGALGRTAALAYNLLERWSARRRHAPARIARIIHTFHGHVLEGYFGRMRSWVFLAIERWLARHTDRIVAVSPTIREDLLRRGIGCPDRVCVVPLGLPLDSLVTLPMPDPYREVLRVGIVGRLVPVKNHQLFLQVARDCRHDPELSRLRFVVVGDGELRSSLERTATQWGINGSLTFTGWRFDPPDIYRQLDIVCLTSLNEGTPVSLIEALAAGRPVIATDVGGVRDLLGPLEEPCGVLTRTRYGLLVRSGDVQGFHEGLRNLAAHPEERQAMGLAGRAHVQQRYNSTRLVEEIGALYEELLNP